MALITCPDCGKTISDKAEFCVNCGCPMNYIKSQCDVYLFCLVEFIDNIHSKEYYYISDDENASVGNFAIVEISGSNEEKIVKIIKTVLCTRETEAPYPIPSTKHLKRILYGREIETVILKYMDVYVKLFKDKRFNDAAAYLNKFFPLIQDYANKGMSFGQFALGVMYEVVHLDKNSAIKWYQKAASQGDKLSNDALKRLTNEKNEQEKKQQKMINRYESSADEFDYRDWMDYTGGEPLDSFFDHEDDD